MKSKLFHRLALSKTRKAYEGYFKITRKLMLARNHDGVMNHKIAVAPLSGERIRNLRNKRGISQELLADHSGVSLRTIQRIESGASIPRLHTLSVIANALNVPIDQIAPTEQENAALNPIPDQEPLRILRLINLSALSVLICPFANIVLTLLLWRRNRHIEMVDLAGRKIISFQIIWLISAFITVISIHTILRWFTGEVSIGHFPPAGLVIYFVFLTIHAFFTLQAAARLNQKVTSVYTFVPSLL